MDVKEKHVNLEHTVGQGLGVLLMRVSIEMENRNFWVRTPKLAASNARSTHTIDISPLRSKEEMHAVLKYPHLVLQVDVSTIARLTGIDFGIAAACSCCACLCCSVISLPGNPGNLPSWFARARQAIYIG